VMRTPVSLFVSASKENLRGLVLRQDPMRRAKLCRWPGYADSRTLWIAARCSFPDEVLSGRKVVSQTCLKGLVLLFQEFDVPRGNHIPGKIALLGDPASLRQPSAVVFVLEDVKQHRAQIALFLS